MHDMLCMDAERDAGEPPLDAAASPTGPDDRRRRFEAAALPHFDAVYSLARWLTGTAADAEDVAQEAFLRAYRYFETWRGEDCRVWLLAITRHAYVAWVQRNRNRRLSFGLEHDDARAGAQEPFWAEAPPTPEAELLRQGDKAALARLVQRLPPDYRATLVLREFEDLSYQDIARVLGVPVGTVMSRLARARALLRKGWRREG